MTRTGIFNAALTAATVFSLLVICGPLYAAGADDDASEARKTKELFIGQTVKFLVKSYITAVDIDKAKRNNIAALEKMDDKEFRKRYTTIYNEMKGLPQDVKNLYGIDENMDRAAAIRKIRDAEKKDLYTIIDSIPDAFIYRHFDGYLADNKNDKARGTSMQDLIAFWNSIRKKLEGE